MDPQRFVSKWAGSTRTERAASQEHFIDICRMLGEQTPNDADPIGDWYAFEKGADKIIIEDPDAEDGEGFADVWKRGHFAWEYKGKRKSLDGAYKQLLRYRESLENPPLLVVCDLDKFEVHTNFTNTAKVTHSFDLATLRDAPAEPRRILRAVFTDPEQLRPEVTPDELTQQAAADFAKLADRLRDRGHEGQEVAHFLNRLVFCLFAEDAGLLPQGLLERIAEPTRLEPELFSESLQSLFARMSKSGGLFGTERIDWFDGGLFDSDEVLPLQTEEIDLLRWVGRLDWSQINPAIFGTLFERGLDPGKRSQLGAHYTDAQSIERVVEPVVMDPLRHEFEAVKSTVLKRAAKSQDQATARLLTGGKVAKTRKAGARPTKRAAVPGEKEVLEFLTRLREMRVLDPACGSGNFLYVALRGLKDLERDVIMWASETIGLGEFPRVGPQNVLGIELNIYAAELARVTIWIGEIQWMVENGFSYEKNPILQPLDNIVSGDALMEWDDDGSLVEVKWPTAEFIVGNPPFLGGKFLRRELGDDYVDDLFQVFSDRVPREADFVTYWHEKARAQIEDGGARRVGLLATQGIRGGANRKVLERVKETGDIFLAWPDEPWVVEGATVHVSIVGFDDGSETERLIAGIPVPAINANLTTGTDVTRAVRLTENLDTAFMGDTKGGPFDVSESIARELLSQPNPDGRNNKDVVRPWVNSLDVMRRSRNMWIIDFPPGMTLTEAALYEAPFEYVTRTVKASRESSRSRVRNWWMHERPRPDMRTALSGLDRFIVTPTVSKHRVFTWLRTNVLPDHQLIVIARDDDFTFAVLHSRIHEVWARRMGTQLREAESGFRYTPSTTFETFPLPRSSDEERAAVGETAAKLHHLRSQWLDPPGQDIDLKQRTLTNLYNEMPTWLRNIHEELDVAVAAAYGRDSSMSDDEILAYLLELNQQRGSQQDAVGTLDLA